MTFSAKKWGVSAEAQNSVAEENAFSRRHFYTCTRQLFVNYKIIGKFLKISILLENNKRQVFIAINFFIIWFTLC